VDFIAVEQSRIDRGFIARSHRRGQLVYAWTVNSQADMERLIDLGIDGLITDKAALAAKVRDSNDGDRALRQVKALLAG
jgi:glycerophosphoryl diester phosphodiesterase